jgi:hypothetical protein
MDTVEIRPNRKYLMPFTVMLVLALFFMNYLTFLTDYYNERHFIWKVLSLVLSASLIIAIYRLYKQIRTNTPSIIMSANAFTYYQKGKLVSYQWSDLTSWNISSEDNTTYLTLEVYGKKHKIGISWLDKSSDQINELILQFKHKYDS